MKAARRRPARPAPSGELARLRARLATAEDTLLAIRTGEVDAVVVAGKQGPTVFTLQGAEYAYRVLIESMNEGALTLTPDKTILYANQCFARMVRSPLEQVIGGSLRSFLSPEDRATLRPLLKRTTGSGSKLQAHLKAGDGSLLPVQLSIRRMERNGPARATFGMVVTDLTETRRSEEQLRSLTNRVMQAQEAERGRVALELHDNIAQLLCAVLLRSQALADSLSGRDGRLRKEALNLRDMLGRAADEVERMSRNLRPSVLDQLGLVAVLRDTSTEFGERTGVSTKVTCLPLAARLPAQTELTLYRILQEALRNVEKHAGARNVSVSLRREGGCVQLLINDDGIGFDAVAHLAGRNGNGGLGLTSMRERVAYAGGTLSVKSARRAGTEIDVRIPLRRRPPPRRR